MKSQGIDCNDNDVAFITGRGPDNYKKEFLGKFQVDWEEYRKEQRKSFYKIFEKDLPIIKENINLAKKLKEKGYKIALVTASSRKSTEYIMGLIKLDNFFDVMVTNEDYANGKPSPDPYLTAAKKLSLKPTECIAVEDSKVGLLSAKSAGMKCIIVRTNNTINEDYSKADLILELENIKIENIKELLA